MEMGGGLLLVLGSRDGWENGYDFCPYSPFSPGMGRRHRKSGNNDHTHLALTLHPSRPDQLCKRHLRSYS